jgi:proline dehydrogenase
MENSAAGWRLARRFVAGATLEQVVAATRAVNAAGIAATIDHLGEHVASANLAQANAQSYHAVLEAILANRLHANASIKLTNLGLDLDAARCARFVCSLAEHAARCDSFIRVDMESSAYTQRTVDLVRGLHRNGVKAVGTVIQACLRRSPADVARLCSEGIRIRLVKGAYREPKQVAFARKAEVDKNFLDLAGRLLSSGLYHAIATHDERIIRALIAFVRQEKISRHAFEFQMLYGVRRDLQQRLAAEGWRVRVYIPFGSEWYPYFMRRLGERPANFWFLAKNLLRE